MYIFDSNHHFFLLSLTADIIQARAASTPVESKADIGKTTLSEFLL
jgi:hypothetical protein